MGSNYARTAFHRQHGCGQPGRQPLIHRAAGQVAQRAFAGQSHQYGSPEIGELRQICQQHEILLMGLSEAEAGVNDEPLGSDARVLTRRNTQPQELDHIARQCRVHGIILHRSGHALHVHDAYRHIGGRN